MAAPFRGAIRALSRKNKCSYSSEMSFNDSLKKGVIFFTISQRNLGTSSKSKLKLKIMPDNIVGKIPDFTSDSEVKGNEEEVKQPVTEEEAGKEKETPTEPPADKKPVQKDDDIGNIDEKEYSEKEKAVKALEEQRQLLLREIIDLRGQRREIKEKEIQKVETKIDELKDLHPDDVNLIEKVLRAKGYVTKEESHKMFYDSVKQEETAKFLEKYPEYKPENDPNDLHWNVLQKELKDYFRLPDDPHLIGKVLEKAYKGIVRVSSERGTETKKRQIETASVGGGGVQRSSSIKTLEPRRRQILEAGGWSEEEIKKIEQSLQE